MDPVMIWSVTRVQDGLSGRGDWAAAALISFLSAGWEPFAVANGFIWLRILREQTP